MHNDCAKWGSKKPKMHKNFKILCKITYFKRKNLSKTTERRIFMIESINEASPLIMGSNPITAFNFEFNTFYDIIDVK